MPCIYSKGYAEWRGGHHCGPPDIPQISTHQSSKRVQRYRGEDADGRGGRAPATRAPGAWPWGGARGAGGLRAEIVARKTCPIPTTKTKKNENGRPFSGLQKSFPCALTRQYSSQYTADPARLGRVPYDAHVSSHAHTPSPTHGVHTSRTHWNRAIQHKPKGLWRQTGPRDACASCGCRAPPWSSSARTQLLTGWRREVSRGGLSCF